MLHACNRHPARRTHRRDWLLRLLLVLPLSAAAAAPAATELRGFEVDDLFRLEGIGEYFGGAFAFAPDGTLALTRLRPASTLADHRWEWLLGNAAGDIWLQAGDEPAVNLTQGASDGSGWWAPEWSPDGRYLAMLSTRGGMLRVWLWDTRIQLLQPLSERPAAARGDGRGFWWMGPEQLVFRAGPPGGRSTHLQLGLSTPDLLADAWARVAAGQESTASVLESGVPPVPADDEGQQLLVVDIATGKARPILEGAPVTVLPSPTRTQFAWVREEPGPAPVADRPVSFDHARFALGVVSADGRALPLRQPITSMLPPELRWSPDGSRLAVLGVEATPTGQAVVTHFVETASGVTRRVQLAAPAPAGETPEASGLLWLRSDAVLVRVVPAGDDAAGEWRLVRVDGTQQTVAAPPGGLPAQLWARRGHAAFFGVAGGKLLQLEADGTVQALAIPGEPASVSLEWPLADAEGPALAIDPAAAVTQVVLATGSDAERQLFVLDLDTGEAEPLPVPASDAHLVARDAQTGSTVFLRGDARGLQLWRARPGADAALSLVTANAFLADIRPAEARRIQYRSLAGAELSAWLLLPAGRKPGEALPLITWVYPGWTASEKLPWEARLDSAVPMNMQIPAARGYAVLIPSMPVDPADTDPLLRLADGVLPALDQAMREASIDPQRLYLLGHSYGGYAVLGLLTRTDRFAAAASLAGISSLIGMYGEFDARQRYQKDAAPEAMFGMFWTEVGQGGMHAPPWAEPERYLRNSPLFHVRDITTPLMLVHGDLDAVPLQQAEEMFTALYREGRRARFVRYWGEGHILQSPANIRDLWQRLFAWFTPAPAD